MPSATRPARALRRALVVLAAAALALPLAAPGAAAGASTGSAGGTYEAQVVGGSPVGDGAAPWMAALVVAGRDGTPQPFCGGTLVEDRWVLTAAHCVEEDFLDGRDVAVHVGMTDLADAARPIAVSRIVVHPEATGVAPWPADAALLRLAEPAGSESIALASGADLAAYAPGAAATTLGWGLTDPEADPGDGEAYPERLQAAATPLHSDLACARAIGGGFDDALMTCAGAAGRASCTGDSGGPLVATQRGEPRLLGVVSSGRGRCADDPRSLYVTVAGILDWIEEVTGGEVGAGEPARLGGDDVHATAAAITRQSFDPGQRAVYAASSADFPDGLAGGALAARSGPLLLVPPEGALPDAVDVELGRLAPEEIVVLGGEAAVGRDVAAALEDHAPVRRLAGDDRYATAAAVARQWGHAETVFLATGQAYPDALATVPLTVGNGPVALTRTDRLPAPTRDLLADLDPETIVVLGGEKAISAEVEAELSTLAGEVRRVAGADRYATAAALARDRLAPGGPSTVYATTGRAFGEALVGGVTAAAQGSPLLLVHPERPPEAALGAIDALGPRRVVTLGDEGAVSGEVAAALHAATVRWGR